MRSIALFMINRLHGCDSDSNMRSNSFLVKLLRLIASGSTVSRGSYLLVWYKLKLLFTSASVKLGRYLFRLFVVRQVLLLPLSPLFIFTSIIVKYMKNSMQPNSMCQSSNKYEREKLISDKSIYFTP